MLKKITSKLEDPDHPLLGPNIKILKFFGLILPKKGMLRIFYIAVQTSLFFFMFTEFIDLYIWAKKSNIDLLLTNIKSTSLAVVCAYKIATFYYWQEKWKNIMEYVTKADIEARNSDDEIKRKIVKSYTKYCRTISYLYWALTYSADFGVIALPISKFFSSTYRENVRNGTEVYTQVVNSWTPFDTTQLSGYIKASIWQLYVSVQCANWICSYDTNAIVIMVYFKAELELLKRSCSKIFDVEDHEEVMGRIKAVHEKQREFLKYSALYNSCLSPIMFLYMVACSIMLCASLYQTTTQTSFTQKFLTAPYLIFGVAQLFIYCWHGNEVLFMSREPMRGVYESGWWKRALYRKEVILLTGQLDRTVVYTAGPFFGLNLANFISILKGAYSYYMLIIKKNEN